MTLIKDSIVVLTPPERVHSVATDPQKWSTWFAGLGPIESINGGNEPGTEIKQSYLMAGMHLHFTTRVTENSRSDDGAYHWRADNEGSLTGWNRWDYLPHPEGTLVSVEMEYEVPGSVLGKVADRLFIERHQERALHSTLENLKFLAESEL